MGIMVTLHKKQQEWNVNHSKETIVCYIALFSHRKKENALKRLENCKNIHPKYTPQVPKNKATKDTQHPPVLFYKQPFN